MTRQHLTLAFVMSLLAGCASAPRTQDEAKIVLSDNNEFKMSIVPTKALAGSTAYTFRDGQGKVEWMGCKRTKDASALNVLVFHSELAGFDVNKFCDGWIAQAFLQSGYSVYAVNRPSYGASTGGDDFSGEKSIAAILAAVSDAKLSAIEGVWGFSAGSIAAAFFTKKTPNIKWAIFGNGLYDLEVIGHDSTDNELKSKILALQEGGGEKAFETRSIAWDIAGLPKKIGIYHTKDNKSAPAAQTDSFIDQLRTSEVKVFRTEVEGSEHALSWKTHAQILSQVLKQMEAK
jgi:pimeloyl-ACP methyl ester carboxylesterase